jgi:sugar phosphate isomerase/epimerase
VRLPPQEPAGRPPSFEFLIPLGWERREESLAFARQHGLGVEITAFLSGPLVNNPAARALAEENLAAELAGFRRRTFHGVFLDLAPHSRDEAIATVSLHRIERDLATARRLGCRKVVFHLGFNPLVGGQRHRAEFLDRQASFWSGILDRHPALEICLENQWESDWTIFEDLFEMVGAPRLGMCLDVAHAHVHSHFTPHAWIAHMAPHVLHLHWTDNHGDRDRHAALGAGNIDWSAIIAAGAPCDTVTLEMNALPLVRRSLAFLAQRGLLPCLPIPPRAHTRESLLV